MKTLTSCLVLLSWLAVGLAAPANNRFEERQRDKTYTITCLGPKCTDYPPTTLNLPTTYPSIPGGNPQPTTTPKPSSTKKTSSSSKYTPPPETSKYTPPPETSRYTPPPQTSKYTPPPVTSHYTPPPTKTTKTEKPPTKTQTGETGPSSTRCPVPLYYQCGGYYNGVPWTGCTKCVSGAVCVQQNDFYYQCVADDD